MDVYTEFIKNKGILENEMLKNDRITQRYWFEKTDGGFQDWIEVDVVSGTIEELQ